MTTPEHDELDLTAAEYVLGTLEPEQASAFRQRLADSAAARARLAVWEDRLARLALDLEPVAPPAYVWEDVARAIGIAREQAADRRPAAPAAPGNDFKRARRWRRLALAASLAAIVLAGLAIFELPVWRGGGQIAPTYASVIYDKPTGMSWLVTSSDDGKKLSVQAMGDFKVPAGKMLRMWIKAGDGKPQLVGELPHTRGHYTMALPSKLRSELGDHAKIMVSMEDTSRAGTRTPGGKLMWVAPVAHRTG
ncbi:anti-sigma factor [Salinisphaera sp.]|uniref:anti-sigma factor n=1 Tax=Salinisphaera sp. TaxID=1914330 RepID=UPI002D781318|nr:anti-sigma factor [Salinisphaera sp.]HET7314889.1 anti-sigma factor [Salinisphaera sp.]